MQATCRGGSDKEIPTEGMDSTMAYRLAAHFEFHSCMSPQLVMDLFQQLENNQDEKEEGNGVAGR